MVISGIDPHDLSQTGWGVIFPHDAQSGVREALSPLLEVRRAQAGDLYKEFSYRLGESKNDFLHRQGVGPGPVDPQRMPYYLLLVGSPRQIPFRVQRQFGVQYAIGRLDFDSPDDYAAYARSTLRAEQSWQPQRAVFFGTQHPGDVHTSLTTNHFLKPLADKLITRGGWEVEVLTGDLARKESLVNVLAEGSHPALLLLAGHGLGYPNGHSLQQPFQGALLCQDWPGPNTNGPISPDWCFTADDLTANLDLTGMIWVQSSSFSAGTDERNSPLAILHRTGDLSASEPFVSRLAQRLLSLPAGGALAVVGLVGQMWGYASPQEMDNTRLVLYQESVDRLAKGDTLGLALELVHERYAETASDLSVMLEEHSFGAEMDELRLINLWAEGNDAGGLVICGDPAVRLATASYEAIVAQKQSNIGISGSVNMLSDVNVSQVVGRDKIVNITQHVITQPTGDLQAELQIRMARLPTAIYRYLSPEQHQLASVRLTNANYDRSLRARLTAEIEGYSPLQTVEASVNPHDQTEVNLSPVLHPGVLDRLQKVTRANFKVLVEDIDTGRIVGDNRQIWLMDANTLPLAVRDPTTAEWQDFALYLGLFITPQASGVEQMVKAATSLHPSRKLAGYQSSPDDVEAQVRAIDAALRDKAEVRRTGPAEIKRTSESITLLKVRPPDRLLEVREANDLEYALLFASLLAAVGLNAAMFISDRLICAAWQSRPDSDEWAYLDFKRVNLPLIGEALNFAAHSAATKGLVRALTDKRARPGDYPPFIQVKVADMRRNGVQPLK